MNYLLDTNVISELVAKRPHKNVVAWIDSVDDEKLYLSVITLGEIQRGIAKLPESSRKTQIEAWLEGDLRLRFQNRILPLDEETMLLWGRLTAALDQIGRPLPAIDSLLAAQAIKGELHLVTRNARDFVDSGVMVIDPWQVEG